VEVHESGKRSLRGIGAKPGGSSAAVPSFVSARALQRACAKLRRGARATELLERRADSVAVSEEAILHCIRVFTRAHSPAQTVSERHARICFSATPIRRRCRSGVFPCAMDSATASQSPTEEITCEDMDPGEASAGSTATRSS